MRTLLMFAVVFASLSSGCFLLDDSYEPCSTIEGTGVPAPGPTPGTDPVPTGPQPNDASGDRYRRASNGLICRCGDYDPGCYGTPDEALKASACRPSPLGPEYEPNCQPLGVPGNGETPPTPEASAPVLKWSCPYTITLRRDGKSWDEVRIRTAQTHTKANWSHFAWCSRNTDSTFEYRCRDCDTTPVP